MLMEQFRVFSVVAQANSFSKAAKLLHLSQPAVSSKIQAMEDMFGAKLFTRTAQGVTLTEAGRIALEYSDRFLDLEQSMTEEISQLLSVNHPLVIGASCTSGNYALPGCISRFKEKYPQASVKLDISNSVETIQKLNKKEIDLAIVDGSVDTSLPVRRLDSIALVFVAANSDRFKKTRLTFKELRSRPFIVREKGAAMRTVMEQLAAQNGCTLNDFNIVSEMNSLHSIKSAVLGGAGITLLPLVGARQDIQAGNLRLIQVDDLQLMIDVNLVYRVDEESTPVTHNFVKFLTNTSNPGFCWQQ